MQITLPSYKMSRVPGDVLLTRSERFKILCRGSRCLAWRSTALQLWFGAFKAVLHRFLKGLQRSPCNQEQLCAPGRTSPAASLFCEELSFEAHQACCILQPRRNKSIRLTLVCVSRTRLPPLFRCCSECYVAEAGPLASFPWHLVPETSSSTRLGGVEAHAGLKMSYMRCGTQAPASSLCWQVFTWLSLAMTPPMPRMSTQ